MSQFTTIQEFNIYLSDNLKNIKLNEYFNLIQSQFYSNLDISFMDYFLELITKKDDICIEHQKLIEYGIINTKRSNDIKDCLEKFNAQENIDFECLTAEPSAVKRTGRGGANGNKKEYKLTPKLFKLCLMRSIKENKYANYYLLLEECFYYFQEYQIMYQNNIINGITDENKSLHKKIDELLNYGKQTTEKLNKIHEQNEDLLEDVDELKDRVEDLQDQNEDLKDTMEDIKDQNENLKDTIDEIKDAFKDTADRSVPNPKEEIERHEFILLQHKELTNTFKFIRGIQKYNDSKINKKYSEYHIIKREFNANPIQLFKQFKEIVKEEYKLEKAKITANKTLKNKLQLKKEVEKIKFTSNDLELQFGYTLDNLLDKLSEVCNERFNEYNNSCDEE
jgi:phage shock protein A